MSTQGFATIDAAYLLVTAIPFYADTAGNLWVDRLWHKDLALHTRYIQNLTVVAPRLPKIEGLDDLALAQDASGKKIRFVALPPQNSFSQALIFLPRTLFILTREVRRSLVVHSGIIGWPIPLGWIANSVALLLGRRLVLVVESAPWRLHAPGPHSVRRRLRAWLSERLGRFFMRRADLAVATHPGYLKALRGLGSKGAELVNPASWIDEKYILSPEAAFRTWIEKRSQKAGAAFLFAGRLTPEKGLDTLLEAVRMLDADGQKIRVDVIGSGPMMNDCVELAARLRSVEFSVLPQTSYGSEFFSLLRQYHVVLVPNRGDEQPRIIYDAFSQGVPVIATRTEGNRSLVADGETGWLTDIGAARELASTVRECSRDLAEAQRRGLNALHIAKQFTHSEMHRVRSRAIASVLSS